MNQNDNGVLTVVKQTLLVLLFSAVVVGASLPVYYLISTGGYFEWSLLKFALGSVYGMLLGVGNFFAMAISMILITASALDAKEGKVRAQSGYMLRLLFVVGFAVVGCLIPIFHIVSVLGSLALTQLVIVVYSLIGSLINMKKNPVSSPKPVQDGSATLADPKGDAVENKDEE